MSRKLIHCACQSSGLSSPRLHRAGRLQRDSRPFTSQTFTLQKHDWRDASGWPAYTMLTVSSLATLPESHRSPCPAASLAASLATKIR